jgi:uncharacterized integral membrane protein
MTKKVLWALILIFIVVVILIMNTDKGSVNLVLGQVKAIKSIIYLCFVGIGVVIGVLLK